MPAVREVFKAPEAHSLVNGEDIVGLARLPQQYLSRKLANSKNNAHKAIRRAGESKSGDFKKTYRKERSTTVIARTLRRIRSTSQPSHSRVAYCILRERCKLHRRTEFQWPFA